MRYFFLLSLSLFLISCQYFEEQVEENVVARVGSNYLYETDIENLVGPVTSEEDSMLIVNLYINNWATQKLLMEKARINLSPEKLKAYDELVENYKTDLYTKGYTDIIATQSLNTEISEKEYEKFYNQNKDNFLLNEELILLRYIHVGNDNTSINTLRQQLIRFDEKDQKSLKEREIQFKSFLLNDSIWVQANTVMERIPAVNSENFNELLKKSNSIELQDSLGVYLIFVKDVLLRNDIAPISYVKPTIEQIILNRRKLDIVKNLEKDILQDAIKNKKFEVFN
tara:strand:- start:161397 stop:162245 length:849 start_codon:yes stop_codon:yes gene_type:complete